MKRIMICLLLLSVMLSGMMSVYAAEAEITVQVRASKTEVQVGDTVEYTVLATGSGVVAMQFELRFPEGLRYVPNSGATPENLAQKLGVPAADWTEISKMFTFYNDIGITFAEGTEILRFSCVAEKEGEWAVELYELLPFDGDFLEFTPKLQVQKIRVTASEGQTAPPATGETLPPAFAETEPPVSTPEETVSSSIPENPGEVTQPATAPDREEEQVAVNAVPEPTEPTQADLPSDTEQPAGPEDGTDPAQGQQKEERPKEEQPKENIWRWLFPVGGVTAIACGAAVFVLMKKKRS